MLEWEEISNGSVVALRVRFAWVTVDIYRARTSRKWTLECHSVWLRPLRLKAKSKWAAKREALSLVKARLREALSQLESEVEP